MSHLDKESTNSLLHCSWLGGETSADPNRDCGDQGQACAGRKHNMAARCVHKCVSATTFQNNGILHIK